VQDVARSGPRRNSLDQIRWVVRVGRDVGREMEDVSGCTTVLLLPLQSIFAGRGRLHPSWEYIYMGHHSVSLLGF
jgi:hypothetical protein